MRVINIITDGKDYKVAPKSPENHQRIFFHCCGNGIITSGCKSEMECLLKLHGVSFRILDTPTER